VIGLVASVWDTFDGPFINTRLYSQAELL